MTTEPSYVSMSLRALRSALDQRAVTAVAVAEHHLAAMNRIASLNAYVAHTVDWVMEQARAADRMILAGRASPLTGIPVAVKDVICAAGLPTTAGSNILRNFHPAYDAHVVERLRHAGAVMLGKTNMDEFAMGSANIHSCFGPAVNPWRKASDPGAPLTPGGSSGGSAAAVAARAATVALGTDTGGSVRAPASYCGLTAIKPTYGRCSRWGVIAYASSLDQVGTFGRHLYDATAALETIWGHDSRDATSIPETPPALTPIFDRLPSDLRGRKIGIIKDMLAFDVEPAVRDAWQRMQDLCKDRGAEVVSVSIPSMRFAHAAYFVIATSECSSNLARYDGIRYGHRASNPKDLDDLYARSRGEGFGSEVQWRILAGAFALSAGYIDAYYGKAQAVRRTMRDEFIAVFNSGVDVVLMPSTPSVAFPISHLTNMKASALSESLNDLFLSSISLAGLPAVALPVGYDDDRLPVGIQLAAAPRGEQRLIEVAAVLESLLGFTLREDVTV